MLPAVQRNGTRHWPATSPGSASGVYAFDMGFRAELAEPGNDPAVRYHQQHITAATEIEQRLAAALGVDWARRADLRRMAVTPVTPPSQGRVTRIPG
jgi:hypothetical protein